MFDGELDLLLFEVLEVFSHEEHGIGSFLENWRSSLIFPKSVRVLSAG